MSHDKRKFDRKKSIFYLEVFDQDSEQLLGRLVDITTEGLLLISENPIELGRKYRLRMLLPRQIEGRESIFLHGKSLWNRPSPNPDFVETGFRCDQTCPESVDAIEILTRLFCFK